MKILKISLIISVLIIFIAACNETKPANTTNVNSVNSAISNTSSAKTPAMNAELAAAKQIYNDKCAKCHKEDGTGGKLEIEGTTIKASNLTTDKMKNTEDAKYIKYIVEGIPDEGMPAFKGKLTDEQIKDVVKYVRAEFQSK